MKIFDAYVSPTTQALFQEKLSLLTTLEAANTLLESISGIRYFFETITDFEELIKNILLPYNIVEDFDRAEYGDFQTNTHLAASAIKYLAKYIDEPDVMIEPTCGKGNFIIAALEKFRFIKKVYGVEIYKPYVWETKFSILDFFLRNPNSNKPEIFISHCSVFDFNFNALATDNITQKFLLVGNPPWVTNSMLGSLNSSNIPVKSNFKNHNGIDAITGKGNFDIAEYITIMLLDAFQLQKGALALLIKNSVIKNIVLDQKKNKYKIARLEKHCIDSKKEFDVSVDASLFFCHLNVSASFECEEFNFYQNSKPTLRFGWVEDKFVSNIETYSYSKEIDGESPFVWRQGLKHDCSNVMELEKSNGHYVNGLNEEVKLEDGLVYGLLKSSDLKNTVINQTRKFTIVTQKKVGQETKYIKYDYPKTYQYLIEHQSNFDARKSTIYNNKPSFSIFGIGDYSFKSYKVAISGLYKTFHFTLILPQLDKPVMLDDTCYMLGFDKIEFAVYTLLLLNSNATKQFLQSVTFADAKRTFTKDVLMRIDLLALAKTIDQQSLQAELNKLNDMYKLCLTLELWNSYLNEMTPVHNRQFVMFA